MITVKDVLTSKTVKVVTTDNFYSYKFVRNKTVELYCNYLRQPYDNYARSEKQKFDEPIRTELMHEKHDYLYLEIFSKPNDYPINTLNESLCNSLMNTIVSDFDEEKLFDKQGLVLMPKGNKLGVGFFIFKYVDRKLKVAYHRNNDKRGVLEYDFEKERICETNVEVLNFFTNFILYTQTLREKGKSKITTTAKTKHKPKVKTSIQVITPVEIGEGYKTIESYKPTIGKQAKPSQHWRSGHWRKQPTGKRTNPDYVNRWIKPVLINEGVINGNQN